MRVFYVLCLTRHLRGHRCDLAGLSCHNHSSGCNAGVQICNSYSLATDNLPWDNAHTDSHLNFKRNEGVQGLGIQKLCVFLCVSKV